MNRSHQAMLGSGERCSLALLSMQLFLSIATWAAAANGRAADTRDLLLLSSVVGVVVLGTAACFSIAHRREMWIAATSAFTLIAPIPLIIFSVAVLGIGWTNC